MDSKTLRTPSVPPAPRESSRPAPGENATIEADTLTRVADDVLSLKIRLTRLESLLFVLESDLADVRGVPRPVRPPHSPEPA